MKTKHMLALLLWTILISAQSMAQDAVKTYLGQTDPVIVEVNQNIQSFLNEVTPLRETNDIVGLKKTADKYIAIWNGMLSNLAKIKAPAEGTKHYNSLKRVIELQKESNEIMANTLDNRIGVILKIQEMKKANATKEAIDEFIKANTLDRNKLVAETTAVKTQTSEADAVLKSERDRLLALIKTK